MTKYKVTAHFFNEGELYGTEEFTVEAVSKEEAEGKAMLRLEESMYDDPRLPCRSRRVEIEPVC